MTIDAIIRRPDAVGQRQRAVAWSTVLPLAAVMAFADGFWTTSLRGAVGAIERSQSPFTNWWHQSAVALPIYILGVLGAFALAQHWFGPVLPRYRSVAATAVLVIAAGTVIGIAQIAANSAYDYHLQSNQLQMMDSMHGICAGSCLAQAQHATLIVHIHAVIYVSKWILITNLILIAWMVAMLGGRLNVSALRRRGAYIRGRATDSRLVLAVALLASAAIHLAVTPEHLTEWSSAGLFFILLSAAEIAVAALMFTRLRQRAVLIAAVVISIAPLVIWLYSRTVGLPFGPEAGTPEAIGLPDIAACALEIAALLVALILLQAPAWLRRPPVTAHTRALVLVALGAVTVIGLAATSTTWSPAIADSPSHSATH